MILSLLTIMYIHPYSGKNKLKETAAREIAVQYLTNNMGRSTLFHYGGLLHIHLSLQPAVLSGLTTIAAWLVAIAMYGYSVS